MAGEGVRVHRAAKQENAEGEGQAGGVGEAAASRRPQGGAEQRKRVPALHLDAAGDDAFGRRVGDAVGGEGGHGDGGEAGQGGEGDPDTLHGGSDGI